MCLAFELMAVWTSRARPHSEKKNRRKPAFAFDSSGAQETRNKPHEFHISEAERKEESKRSTGFYETLNCSLNMDDETSLFSFPSGTTASVRSARPRWPGRWGRARPGRRRPTRPSLPLPRQPSGVPQLDPLSQLPSSLPEPRQTKWVRFTWYFCRLLWVQKRRRLFRWREQLFASHSGKPVFSNQDQIKIVVIQLIQTNSLLVTQWGKKQ